MAKTNKPHQSEEKPPIFCNKEAEEAVIGGILSESTAFGLVSFLRQEMFYVDKHADIFKSVQDIYDAGGKIDTITVSDHLEKLGKLKEMGGKYAIVELQVKVSSTAHIEQHACIVLDEYYRRKIFLTGEKLKSMALEKSEDVGNVIDQAGIEIENISHEAYHVDENQNISKTAENAYFRYLEREKAAKNGNITGIDTGFSLLNKISFGYQPGDLIILAARPGMGKTSVMLHKATAAAKSGKIPVIFSLEMSTEQLTDLVVLSECSISRTNFKNGTLSDSEINEMAKGTEKAMRMNMQINSNSDQTVRKIKSIAKQLKKQGKCDAIYIDYLQLINMRNDNRSYNREQEVSQTTRALKLMAKELGVPVVVLSQLSRSCEDTKDKRPGLQHLRESGAIEQDADIVEFVWRPEYYDVQEYEGKGTHRMIVLDIAKGRGMPTCEIEFYHDGQMSKFTDSKSDMPF